MTASRLDARSLLQPKPMLSTDGFLTLSPDGSFTIDMPSGFSLVALRSSLIGQQLMYDQDWYDQYEWATKPLEAETYRLRLPVPGSNNRKYADQQQLLLPGEVVAPVAIVAAALLCIAHSGHPDPLKGGWVRCGETNARGDRVALSWYEGRLDVGRGWLDARADHIWIASAGTS